MAVLGQARVIDELQMEFADIKAAWFSALEAGDRIADQAIEHMAYFMNVRSMLREAVLLFDESKSEGSATVEHLRALRACFFVMQGDSGRAQSYGDDVLKSHAAPKLATAHAHMALANLAHAGGAFETARRHYETVLRIRRAENDKIGSAFVTIALAGLHISFGDPSVARELIKEGFVISREIGLTFGLVMCHLFAGELALNEDRLEDAHANFVSGLELERSANTPQYRAQLLRRLGALDRRMGKYAEAERYHAEALELLLDLGDQRAQAQAYIELGEDSLAVANLGEARDRFLRGVRLATAFASDHLKNLALLGLARTENSLGNVENAARIANILADTEVAQKEAAYLTLVDAIGPHLPEAPQCDLEDVLTRIANDADARPLML
jgi:tetratricopeptide (TPR) repeat protein